MLVISAPEAQQYLLKKYNLRNQLEAQKKALDLKHERRELRVKLDKFQRDFETNHQRKIRYTKDIGPVAGDFKRYKELKVELHKFDQWLGAGNSSNQGEKKNGGGRGNGSTGFI